MEGIRKGIHKTKNRDKSCSNGNRGGRTISFFRDRFLRNVGGFGMNELLGLAAALIIAGFVVIPGLRLFTKTLMDGLTDWWEDTISNKIFNTSVVSLVQQLFLLR